VHGVAFVKAATCRRTAPKPAQKGEKSEDKAGQWFGEHDGLTAQPQPHLIVTGLDVVKGEAADRRRPLGVEQNEQSGDTVLGFVGVVVQQPATSGYDVLPMVNGYPVETTATSAWRYAMHRKHSRSAGSNRLMLGVWHGAAAGAAGTTALNAVTYLDMVIRSRPASTTPEQVVDAMARTAGVELPGSEQERAHRRFGLGSLAGILTGVGAGAVIGLVRATGRLRGTLGTGITATLLALAGSNGPMTALGVTDPRKWTATDWISDLIPHIAYGAVTALVLDKLSDRQPSVTSTKVEVKRYAHALLPR
jgi:hypothetical protein